MNMTDSQVIERIANNVGCSVPELEQAHREVYENHSPTLLSAGKTEEEAEQVCLMMAAQQVDVRRLRECSLAFLARRTSRPWPTTRWRTP